MKRVKIVEIMLTVAAVALFFLLMAANVPRENENVLLTGEKEGEISRSDLILYAGVRLLGGDAPEEAVKSTCVVLSCRIYGGESLGIVESDAVDSLWSEGQGDIKDMYISCASEYKFARLLKDAEPVDVSCYDGEKAVQLARKGYRCDEILSYFFPEGVLIY